MLQRRMSKGYSRDDMCSVVKLYEEWANVEVKKQGVRKASNQEVFLNGFPKSFTVKINSKMTGLIL